MNTEACDLLCMDLPHAEVIRDALPPASEVQNFADGARAVADPTRVRVAAALAAADELCVCDIAWIVGASPTLVSHHVAVLRRAGLVTSRRTGKLVMSRLTSRGAAFMALIGPGEPEARAGAAPAASTVAARG